MDEGEDTLVGDRGVTLSGGQKARISLARAIYSDKSVILLDDPLSAVDAEVGRQIFENLIELKKTGKCIVLATHQLQTLVNADKVLVLDSGQQVYFGGYEGMKDNPAIGELLGQIHHKVAEDDKRVSNKKEVVFRRQGTIKVIENEIRESGGVPFNLYCKYFKLGIKSNWLMLLIGVFLILSQCFMIATYYWVTVWSDASDQDDVYYYNVFSIIILGLS